MTREQAVLVVKHFDMVKHFAEGGRLEFESKDYKGDFIEWRPVEKGLHVVCLPRYRKSEKIEVNSACSDCEFKRIAEKQAPPKKLKLEWDEVNNKWTCINNPEVAL